MKEHFDSELPSVEHLIKRAKRRMPGFAYDYLSGGCFTEVNLKRNTSDIREIQLNCPSWTARFDVAQKL